MSDENIRHRETNCVFCFLLNSNNLKKRDFNKAICPAGRCLYRIRKRPPGFGGFYFFLPFIFLSLRIPRANRATSAFGSSEELYPRGSAQLCLPGELPAMSGLWETLPKPREPRRLPAPKRGGSGGGSGPERPTELCRFPILTLSFGALRLEGIVRSSLKTAQLAAGRSQKAENEQSEGGEFCLQPGNGKWGRGWEGGQR